MRKLIILALFFSAQALAGVDINGPGANVVSGQWAAAVGIENTVTTTVGFAAGIANSVTDSGSAAIGRNNTVTVNDCQAIGAQLTCASDNGFVSGWLNVLTADQCSASGYRAWCRLMGAHAFAQGGFLPGFQAPGNAGVAQTLTLQMRAVSTNGAPAALVSTGNSLTPRVDSVLTLQDNSVMFARGEAVARDAATGLGCSWTFRAMARRAVGAGSVTLIGTPTVDIEFCETAWTLAVGLDQNFGAINVVLTGEPGHTINLTSHVVAVENVDDGQIVAPPPPPPSGASPDGTTVPPNASLSDGVATWSLDPANGDRYGSNVLRNGVWMAGGRGDKIVWKGGQVKVHNLAGDWWLWTGSGWTQTTAP